MGKASPDVILDAALDEIATSTRLTVLTDEPANFAGIAALLLASVVVTAGDGNGDFTVANGDTNGRKVTVAQQASISISSSGDADHIGLDDGTALQYVTTATLQALVSGGTVTVPAWDVEIADPT